MKFKIDENLPIKMADLLRQAGYDALTIFDQGIAGNGARRVGSAHHFSIS